MMKQLKNNFIQAFGGTIIWVVILTTLFLENQMVPLSYMWNLIGIAALSATVFGLVYPYLWDYATFKAPIKILISTVINTACGFLAAYMFSYKMFLFIRPYVLPVLILTLVGHIFGFYFYLKHENQKLANELNNCRLD